MNMRRTATRDRHEPNTVILDPDRGWGLTYRDNPPGEPLRYRGRLVHLCTLDSDKNLRAVELPPKLAGQLPEDLYLARNWPEVKAIFGVTRSMLEKLQMGGWIAIVGILGFTMFLLAAALMG